MWMPWVQIQPRTSSEVACTLTMCFCCSTMLFSEMVHSFRGRKGNGEWRRYFWSYSQLSAPHQVELSVRCVAEGFIQGAAPAVVPVSSVLAAVLYVWGKAPLASTLGLCAGAAVAKGECMAGSAYPLPGSLVWQQEELPLVVSPSFNAVSCYPWGGG